MGFCSLSASNGRLVYSCGFAGLRGRIFHGCFQEVETLCKLAIFNIPISDAGCVSASTREMARPVSVIGSVRLAAINAAAVVSGFTQAFASGFSMVVLIY